MKLKLGDKVRVKGQRRIAYILAFDDSFVEGAVKLDRKIEGFSWWNVLDLVKV